MSRECKMQNNFLRKKFTLMELVAVMAGIGVLATIMIPVIQKSRQSSNYNNCINNYRQLDVAVHQVSYGTKEDSHVKNPHVVCEEEKTKHPGSIIYVKNFEDLCKAGYVEHKYTSPDHKN